MPANVHVFDHPLVQHKLTLLRKKETSTTSFRRLLNIVPENGMVLINGDDPNCVDVAKICRAQLVEVGFSQYAARRITDVSYDAEGSEFTLLETRFALPMVGEYNVRNAAMAISAAHFYGVSLEAIQKALWNVKVKGINGDIAFIKQGPAGQESAQNVPSVYLVKIENGKVVKN